MELPECHSGIKSKNSGFPDVTYLQTLKFTQIVVNLLLKYITVNIALPHDLSFSGTPGIDGFYSTAQIQLMFVKCQLLVKFCTSCLEGTPLYKTIMDTGFMGSRVHPGRAEINRYFQIDDCS